MTKPAPGSWRLERGATPVEGGVHFSVWAPAADRIDVVLESGRACGSHCLTRGENAVFSGTVSAAAPGDDYRYLIGGGDPVPDPVSRHQPAGVHGPSRVVDHAAFAWTDAEWHGVEMADLVIYELHVGTFTEAGTFDAMIARFAELVALGVTAIELMPVAQFPGERNWGYDGVGLYAPQNSYGGPEGLRRLVDAAHGAGLAVVLDVVYNHLGPEGNYLGMFGPYFTDRYRTPWGSALNYDDADSDDVRRFIIDNALYWITEFHVDALRLDAVHSIFDFSACHILQELTERVHAEAEQLGRRALVIAESDLNDPRVIRPVGQGGLGLDGQWSDDFHHAVHAVLTGEQNGYYEDFGEVQHVARALLQRFVYGGAFSPHRRRRHGARALDVPADRFVVSIQNHDQVGNRALGDRFGTLLPAASQRLAAALLLLNPYVPMLFMGEEYGETNPFQYFVSHGDAGLIQSVRDGRRAEFRSFGWEGEVPDPQSEETFRRSKLNWDRSRQGGHAELLALYRDLLLIRRTHPALRPGEARIEVRADTSAGWIMARYIGEVVPDVLVAFNFSDSPEAARVPLRVPGKWDLLLSTDDKAYGGTGCGHSDGTAVSLPGRGAALFRGGDI